MRGRFPDTAYGAGVQVGRAVEAAGTRVRHAHGAVLWSLRHYVKHPEELNHLPSQHLRRVLLKLGAVPVDGDRRALMCQASAILKTAEVRA